MAELVVLTQGPPDSDVSCTPLGRSLGCQTGGGWRLSPAPGGDLQPDDIVMVLPVETRFARSACETILQAFTEHPEAVALYGDCLVGGRCHSRPAWSPTRVQSEPGASLPLAVRVSRPGFDPADDPLEQERQLAESNAPVLHLPSVLTIHPDWPPPGDEFLMGDPRFEPGERSGTRRRCPSLRGQASTSIIIPSAGVSRPATTRSMLSRHLETLTLLDPPPLEVIVVIGDEFRGEPPQQEDLKGSGLEVKVLHRGPGTFDFSRAINLGLLACRGELVLMANDDLEAETPDWLGRMAAHLDDPTVGAVGAALLYPDRTVQHAGMVIHGGHPRHLFKGASFDELGTGMVIHGDHPQHLFNNMEPAGTAAHGGDVARDAIGVTGACLLARRRDLLAVGGLSHDYPVSYGDIDLCLRLRRTGLRVVIEPAAVLVHHESASREPVIQPWEWNRFIHRWGEVNDPWFHPSFRGPNHPDPKDGNTDADPTDTDPDDDAATADDNAAPTDASGPARSTAIRSRMHESWVNIPWELPAQG
ncbi:glycosyltransferase family 2 protein [Candidatus Poriferisocius sp.]|uniref:glycosyltransferase family 2 protein n=1 Tax=Candidatus Poriferisocius sp. TaxID=3101276 RepID=UPI003B013E5A